MANLPSHHGEKQSEEGVSIHHYQSITSSSQDSTTSGKLDDSDTIITKNNNNTNVNRCNNTTTTTTPLPSHHHQDHQEEIPTTSSSLPHLFVENSILQLEQTPSKIIYNFGGSLEKGPPVKENQPSNKMKISYSDCDPNTSEENSSQTSTVRTLTTTIESSTTTSTSFANSLPYKSNQIVLKDTTEEEEEEELSVSPSSRISHLNPFLRSKKQVDNQSKRKTNPINHHQQENTTSFDSEHTKNSSPKSESGGSFVEKVKTIISAHDSNPTHPEKMNLSNSPARNAGEPYSANAHYSLNFFNLPLEGTSIPKSWHALLKIQASTILFTVYTGYLLQTMYVFREQSHNVNATFWMFTLGALTILVNSGRLIRMDRAENTTESKIIIIFNVISFSIRFFVMQKDRILMLSNSLATIAVMSKNTAHSKGDPFWSMLPIVSMAFHYFVAGIYKIYLMGWSYTLDVIFEFTPCIYTILIFGLFIVFGNVQLSSECDQLQETGEKLKLALDSKSNFVSHLSHEFRTPTLSSLGSIELIKETNLTKEQREHIETIESAENILLTLIEDILLFVKSEHETKNKIQTNTKQVFCLRNCLSSVHEIMKSYAKKFVVDVKIFAENLEPNVYIKMNQARMSQILVNLLTNAVKASHPSQSVELHCRMIPNPPKVITEEDHKWFEFKVIDYGVGIPKSKQEFIFQPFGQLHNLNESIFPSSGLGLSTCLNIVRSMGGCITLESEENHGSTFTIQIPIQLYNMATYNEKEVILKAEDQTVDFSLKRQIDVHYNYLDQFEKADSYVKNAEITKPSMKDDIQIIIAEDNAINRKVLTKMLKSLGFDVDVAVDGKQLVEKIDPSRHKLVITDMHMPFMSGIDASKIIKSKYKDIRIIMLTADALTNSEYYSSVVDAVICKPCTRNDLQNGIRAMLGEGVSNCQVND